MDWPTTIDGPFTAIGDLHGRLDLLEDLLEQLAARDDWRERWLVFLGDYVDRGKDSKGVIDRILDLREHHKRVTAVMGNHDLGMAASLGLLNNFSPIDWAQDWLDYYDAESTFLSYQARLGDLESLKSALPADHGAFFQTLPWLVEHPEFALVHAGMDPSISYEEQVEHLREKRSDSCRPVWLCSKEFFLAEFDEPWPKTVVQGHVVQPEVAFFEKKILVDTGGGRGPLSCVLLPERLVLSTQRTAPSRPVVRRWWRLGF